MSSIERSGGALQIRTNSWHRRSRRRLRVTRLVVVALLACTLVVVTLASPAAAENPPPFITRWGNNGTANGNFDLSPDSEVAVDSSGNVYVADSDNNRIQKFTSTGGFITKWGTFGTGNGQFKNPTGVAVASDGSVYVVDANNIRVQKFTSTGAYVTQWSGSGTAAGHFQALAGVAVDLSGNVYTIEGATNRVQKFTSAGSYLTSWGGFGSGDGTFNAPQGLAVDRNNRVYVADYGNRRVQKFTSTGTFLTKWGAGGVGAGGLFIFTLAVAVDRTGNVYVLDTYQVQKFGPDTTLPTVNLRTPPSGAAYTRNQSVTADFSCADTGGSGLASCVGTVADGARITTSTLGSHNFTVTATDNAGNRRVVTHTYTVRAPPLPDGRIKKRATGTYTGNNVYNTTGTGQTRTGSAARGETVTYFVSVQNDASFPDVLRLRGTSSTSRFTVRYSTNGFDITSQVAAGTYNTPTLASGAAVVVKVKVKVEAAAPAGSSLTGNVTASSNTDPTVKDKVKFVTRRT